MEDYVVGFKCVCEKLNTNPRYSVTVGLKDCTLDELRGIKIWLSGRGIPFKHQTEGLKYNGILVINPTKEDR